jgi:hypothetical protein
LSIFRQYFQKEQAGSKWKEFHKILHLSIFRQFSRKFMFQ